MPKYLYHASPVKDLGVLEPQRTISKDKYIGDFVFATKSRLYALMYLAPNAAGTKIMEVKGDPYIVINCSAQKFARLDKGGAVYTLPDTGFTISPQSEFADSERVSIKPVEPLRKEVFESSLTAMQDAGISIYFLEDKDFKKVLKAGKASRQTLVGLCCHIADRTGH